MFLRLYSSACNANGSERRCGAQCRLLVSARHASALAGLHCGTPRGLLTPMRSTMKILKRPGPRKAGERLVLAFLCLLVFSCRQGASQKSSIPPEVLKLLRQVNAVCGPDVRPGRWAGKVWRHARGRRCLRRCACSAVPAQLPAVGFYAFARFYCLCILQSRLWTS